METVIVVALVVLSVLVVLLLSALLFLLVKNRKTGKNKDGTDLYELTTEDNSTVDALPTHKFDSPDHLSIQIGEENRVPSVSAPILERFAEGRFIDHLDRAIRGFFSGGGISVGSIQKSVGGGYSQAATYMDRLEAAGVVSRPGPSGDRDLLITEEEYEKVIRKKLMAYPYILEEVTVSNIVSRLSDDVYILHSHALEDVDRMDGIQFEYWCAALLRDLGYKRVVVTPSSGDQGVDITAQKDGVRYGFQCKCHAEDQGNTPIQEIYAGIRLYHLHIGVVVTNRHFTDKARELADATGILLWDRDRLELSLRQLYGEQ